MTLPTVVIVVPAFDAEPYLAEALDSLLAQTFEDWRAVVINDGSSDDTGAIAEAYAQRDSRILVVQQPNRGLSAARNVGLATCRGVYYAFLDADDRWRPQKLEQQLDYARRTNAEFVFCGYETFGSGANPAHTPDWDKLCDRYTAAQMVRLLVRRNFILPSCTLIHSSVLDAVGAFDETLRTASDWDLWLRIAGAGYEFQGLPARLCDYRTHAANVSRNWGASFWNNLLVHRRHLPEEMRDHPEVRHFFRLIFRNAFSSEGDAGRFERLEEMLDAYRCYDPAGNAARLMTLLRRVCPLKAWWFLCRYAVIPAAWHIEGWWEKYGRWRCAHGG